MKFKKLVVCSKKSKIILAIIMLILGTCSLVFSCDLVLADTNSDSNNEELTQSVQELVDNIDFSELNDIVNGLDDFNLFEKDVGQKVEEILTGEYFTNYSSIFSGILALIFVDIKSYLPFLFTLIAIGILANLLNEFKSGNESASDVVQFACIGIMILMILFVFKDVVNLSAGTMSLILKQMQIVFPILIAMLTSIGSFSTISIYNPLVAVLTTIVSVVFDKFLFPIFIVVFLFTILSSITNTIKLDKLQSFMTSSFKWIVGIVFTLFAGFLSLQGVSAGKFDSISIKATKFAVKSYIPIIGSYISDGMDFLVLGSVLVKNTIGLVGVLILFISVISPIISILVLKLVLQLSAGILEMSNNYKISGFLSNCSKILIYPIVLILGVAFMYVITIALIMCTANIF